MPRENYVRARPVQSVGKQLPEPNGNPGVPKNLVKVIVAVGLVIFLISMLNIMLMSQRTGTAKRIDQLKREIREAQSVRDDLTVRLMQAENIMQIGDDAENRLGMKVIKPSQIKEVTVRLPKAEPEAPVVENENWFSRIFSFWR